MKKPGKNEPRDEELFREAMADVTPLPLQDRPDPLPRRRRPEAFQQARDDREVLRELDQPGDTTELETGEELLYLRPGYQQRLLQRLRRGHYSVADSIDLHHMDVPTAKQVLVGFIEQSINDRRSCIRIVHGKGLRSRGLPRLKLMTGRVLRQHPRVIAFASCRPVDGGTGATLVLLSARAGNRK